MGKWYLPDKEGVVVQRHMVTREGMVEHHNALTIGNRESNREVGQVIIDMQEKGAARLREVREERKKNNK